MSWHHWHGIITKARQEGRPAGRQAGRQAGEQGQVHGQHDKPSNYLPRPALPYQQALPAGPSLPYPTLPWRGVSGGGRAPTAHPPRLYQSSCSSRVQRLLRRRRRLRTWIPPIIARTDRVGPSRPRPGDTSAVRGNMLAHSTSVAEKVTKATKGSQSGPAPRGSLPCAGAAAVCSKV